MIPDWMWPYIIVGGVVLLVVGAVVYWLSNRTEEETLGVFIPSDRPEELQNAKAPEGDVVPEEEDVPTCNIFISRWSDTERNTVEKIKITAPNTSGYTYDRGTLTLTWDNDGPVNIDSDLPKEENDIAFDSTADEVRKSFTRVFFWYQKDIHDDADTSDDEPDNDWDPENHIEIVLENGETIVLDFNGYDEINDPADFVLESESNGLIRVTDKNGTRYLDTDDAHFILGVSFISNFEMNVNPE